MTQRLKVSAKNGIAESTRIVSNRIESSRVEWSRVESSRVEWSRVESGRVESNQIDFQSGHWSSDGVRRVTSFPFHSTRPVFTFR